MRKNGNYPESEPIYATTSRLKIYRFHLFELYSNGSRNSNVEHNRAETSASVLS